MKRLLLIVTLTLAACVPAAAPENGAENVTNTAGAVAWDPQGKDAIRAKLSAPDAEFRNVQTVTRDGTEVTCGEVVSNGKPQRFVAQGPVIAAMESDMTPAEMDRTWQVFCK
jgi:hypothetical protein